MPPSIIGINLSLKPPQLGGDHQTVTGWIIKVRLQTGGDLHTWQVIGQGEATVQIGQLQGPDIDNVGQQRPDSRDGVPIKGHFAHIAFIDHQPGMALATGLAGG